MPPTGTTSRPSSRRPGIPAGAWSGVVFAPEKALEGVRGLTGGKGTEVTIDCSAAQSARLLCLDAARAWGRVVFVGEGGQVSFQPSPNLIHHQLTLNGSWVIGLVEDLLEFLVRKAIRPDRTVTKRYPLEQAGEAYRASRRVKLWARS